MIDTVNARAMELAVRNKGREVKTTVSECPDCFALVLLDRLAEHIEWHGAKLLSATPIP